MRKEKLHSWILGLMNLMGFMGLMGCSNEDGSQESEPVTMELMSYVTGFEEVSRANNPVTRAWIPPSDYSLYGGSELPISVFFTQADAGSYEEEFFYKSIGKWRMSKTDLTSGNYYLYGYVPHEPSIISTVSVLGEGKTFADGAVLTLRNVPTVSSEDICVVIGAKNGKDDYKADPADYSVTGLQRGDFEYVATGGEGNNYVYLLFDHLFSALRVRMRVEGTYNNLRTIKLKELRMQTSAGGVPTKKKTQITVTLNKNTDGDDPVSSVVFAPDASSDNSDGAVVEWNNGIELTNEYQPFQGHLMPFGVTDITLVSTYDVYDKQGNKVRENCEAKNTINIADLFSGQTETLRGRRYTINMTINPTYLYVLSEPDLNNPTAEVD